MVRSSKKERKQMSHPDPLCDYPDYGPGEYIEVWSDDGSTMLHEVKRKWGWSDSWEVDKVDGIPWRDVASDVRTVVVEYIEAVETAYERRR